MAIELRTVCDDDCILLYDWANNYEVRKNSFNPKEISWEEHKSWFNKKLSNPFSKLFILEKDKSAVGQIRYDKTDENTWELDFSISQRFRGMGLGKTIVELSMIQISGPIVAVVRQNNIASRQVFERLGFQIQNKDDDIIKYIYE